MDWKSHLTKKVKNHLVCLFSWKFSFYWNIFPIMRPYRFMPLFHFRYGWRSKSLTIIIGLDHGIKKEVHCPRGHFGLLPHNEKRPPPNKPSYNKRCFSDPFQCISPDYSQRTGKETLKGFYFQILFVASVECVSAIMFSCYVHPIFPPLYIWKWESNPFAMFL